MITTLSQLIAQAESSCEQYAIRFEPAFVPSALAIQRCATANRCTQATARIICATSWGFYQIMGEELYRREIVVHPIGEWLASANAQALGFLVFTQEKNIAFSLDAILHDENKRLDFATHYNGNGPVYSKYLMEVYAEHSK